MEIATSNVKSIRSAPLEAPWEWQIVVVDSDGAQQEGDTIQWHRKAGQHPSVADNWN